MDGGQVWGGRFNPVSDTNVYLPIHGERGPCPGITFLFILTFLTPYFQTQILQPKGLEVLETCPYCLETLIP